jgi:hypothetical protein
MAEGFTTPTYCSVEDIADFLKVPLDKTTLPNSDQVIKTILRKEDEFDRRTGHAWRIRIKRDEVHSLPLLYHFGWGTPIQLEHRKIQPIDTNLGDKVEAYRGATSGGNNGVPDYDDISSNGAWYNINSTLGKLNMRGFIYTVMRKDRVRITYRYGDTIVPEDVKDAVIKMVAIEILTTSFRMDVLPLGGNSGLELRDIIDYWKEDIDRAIAQYQEFKVLDSP